MLILILFPLLFLLTYACLFKLLSIFFMGTTKPFNWHSFSSILLLSLLFIAIILISINIPDAWWGNRIQHAFGGGFLAFLMCFLIIKDAQLSISRFQFFFLSFLIAGTLGIANEILEFAGQNLTGFVFSTTINDTWLDFVSNTVGILIAAAIFTPLIKKSNPDSQLRN